MLYIRLKNLFILFLIALGIFFHFKFGIGKAWYLYLAAFFLILTNYLMGTVGIAFRHLKKGKIAEAETLLKMTKRPDFLIKRYKSYFHFTKGMIDLQHKNLDQSAIHLEEALQHGLRTENDKALASLNLAHIAFVKKDAGKARTFLDRAKTFQSNDLMISENIEKMEKALG